MRRFLAPLGLAATLAFALPVVALAAGDGGIAPAPGASPSEGAIRQIYWVVFAICAVVFLAVETALVLFVIRFRRRRGVPAGAEGPQIHGNTRLELIWTVVPALILIGIAVFTFVRTPAVRASNPSSAADGKELTIQVEAHQFYWQYVYPTGVITLDTLRLPVDRPVALRITTRDVAHSWWVPELAGKLDAIPSRTNVLRFEPTKVGRYDDGKCAEFCGIQHAFMTIHVQVLPQQAYEAWLRSETTAQQQGHSALGENTFRSVCAKCHGLFGQGGIGPGIRGNSTMLDPVALGKLVANGQDTSAFSGYMPPVGRGWPQRQLLALIRYLKANKTLSTAPPVQSTTGGTVGGSG